ATTSTTSFGWAVAASASQVVIGARSDAYGAGRVYVFDRPSGGWAPVSPSAIVRASYATPSGDGDQFGTGVAVDAGVVAATAPGDDLPHATYAGAAYVLEDVPGAILCPSSATNGCVAGGTGSLDLKYDADKETSNKATWKFGKGPELHRADFGDPTST